MPIADKVQAFIDRLLGQLSDEERAGHGAGFVFPAPGPTIDDGTYGDPDQDTRPEFVKEAERGWTSLRR